MHLGIRVGVACSHNLALDIAELLSHDQDIQATHVVDESPLKPSSDLPVVDALIVEPDVVTKTLVNDLLDRNARACRLVVIGRGLDTPIDPSKVEIISPERARSFKDLWRGVKQRIVQQRLRDFSGWLETLNSVEQVSPVLDQATFTFKRDSELISIRLASIDWIRAAGDHVEIRANGETHLVRTEMYSIEHRLSANFQRIHRKVIINLDRLSHFDSDDSTNLFAVLNTGERFPISRSLKRFVKDRWGHLCA